MEQPPADLEHPWEGVWEARLRPRAPLPWVAPRSLPPAQPFELVREERATVEAEAEETAAEGRRT